MKIKFFKNKKSFKKRGLSTSPEFFWDILLMVGLFIILLSFAFGFILFRQISQEPVSPLNNISQKPKTISKERIDKALQYFSDREIKFTNILNSPAPVTDPSI